jgi:hypothetical protein
VQQSISRHNELTNARVNAGRVNPAAAGVENSGDTGTGASTSDPLGGLGSLLGGLLGGGSLGGVDLGSLLGGGTTTGGSTTGGTSTGGVNVPSNIPPEVIQALQNAGILKAQNGAADSALDKSDQTAQTTTPTSQPSFRVRLLTQLTTTFFAALTVGFQSRDFINSLADELRRVRNRLMPPANDGSGDGDGDGDDGDGDGDGGGIVRLPGRLALLA